MKKIAAALLLAALMIPALPQTGAAQDWDHDHRHDRGGHGEGRPDSHWGGDIHHFGDHDLAYWHGGHWFHGRHHGRLGWWWTLGDSWYYYPSPIYPYPNPYVPPVVAPPPAAATYWYYCHNPRGYYPYVPVCSRPWQEVPGY